MCKVDKGKETEDLIESICHTMFLSDFTVRNPKYKKSSGREKEAADFLIPFDDYLLAFQVKSKSELKSAIEKDEKDFERINSKVKEGIVQLNTIKRALKANHILGMMNSLGINIPFDSKSVKKLTGIVILDLIGEEKFELEERTSIFNGFVYHQEIPVHVFLRAHFDLIATEIDTLPDFINYLDRREILYSKNKLGPLTSELDLLAIYKTHLQWIKDCINDKCDVLIIDGNPWDHYVHKKRNNIEERNKLNKASYFIDHIIKTMHSSIGFQPDIDHPYKKEKLSPGTIESYWEIIFELSKLTRLQRRSIGDKFIDRMKKADNAGQGYALMMLENGKALLILSSNKERRERMNLLYDLSAIAYSGLALRKIIGIATEPFSRKYQSFDTILLDDVKFENHDELAQSFKSSFGSPQHFKTSEYKST